MGSIGATVRKAFGPYERQVSELYRRMFINLDAFSKCISDWANPVSILEIGCGEGALTERLARDFPDADYLGIDIIPHLGRMYKGDTKRVKFQQITANDLAEQKPGAFDVVIINDVLHHVPEDLRKGILDASRSLLAENGVLIFKDWVRRPTPIHAACYFADVYIGGDKNVRYMPLDEQRAFLHASFGADAIEEETTIPPWRQNHAFLVRKTAC